MGNRDVIARCVVDGGTARVVVVLATEFGREAATRHQSTGAAAMAMARAGVAGLLLATLTKGEERVTLQLLGNGALGGLGRGRLVRRHGPRVRREPAPVVYVGRRTRPDWAGRWGSRAWSRVIRDLGLRDRFRGRTSLVDGEIDTDVERYLTDSEQIDSAMGCEVFPDRQGGIAFASGILVQALPGGLGADVVTAARERLRRGEVAVAIRQTAGGARSLGNHHRRRCRRHAGPDVASLVRLGDLHPVRFHCPCSRRAGRGYPGHAGRSRTGDSMIEEDGKGQVICEFCRNSYEFTDENLENIRRGLHPAAAPPSHGGRARVAAHGPVNIVHAFCLPYILARVDSVIDCRGSCQLLFNEPSLFTDLGRTEQRQRICRPSPPQRS